MYSILVLGMIPGTNIAISFQAWLGLADVLAGAYLIYRIERKQRLLQSLLPVLRVPLHASQLHPRA